MFILRHLTYVEHRLAAADAEIRALRRSLRQHERAVLGTRGEFGENRLPLPDPAIESSETSTSLDCISQPPETGISVDIHSSNTLAAPSTPAFSSEAEAQTYESWNVEEAFEQAEQRCIPLEEPPTICDDFDWDEQSISMAPVLDTSANGDEEPEFIDGMASLSVDERDVGYLGVASGAALLRMLRPTEGGRGSISENAGKRRRSSSTILYPQPDPNVHVVDAMIDGYFRSYHLSYPIVHEPRFRAQYSGVIQSPQGTGWQALIYVVAALGAFSTARDASVADITLFYAARSHLSIDHLQSGNITLVQSLTLMSNYLQKRNKPNSGYNYLGLALRMAMGLGLHKEFPGWDIKPLQMEIRRRVWWTLFVFDIGATITFSRPLSWPSKGIDVKLPLNINDRVSIPAISHFLKLISARNSQL